MAKGFQGTYSPKKVSFVVSNEDINHILTGYAEDTGIEVEPNGGRADLYVDMQGTPSRVMNANRSRNVTITLSQTSVSNDILWLLAERDEEYGDDRGLFVGTLKDASGRSLYSDQNCFIVSDPSESFGSSMGTLEWVIAMPDPSAHIGGNARFSAEDQATAETLGGDIAAKWQNQS